MDLTEAVKVIAAAVAKSRVERHLSVYTAAERLDGVGVDWVRTHLEEFPRAWRKPGNGAIMIPEGDVDALAERNRIKRTGVAHG